MHRFFFRSFQLDRRRFAMCVMMLALALRAMVPSGYMPDIEALGSGRIVVEICTASGLVMPAVHGSDKSGHHSGSDEKSASADCPFHFMASLAAMPAALPVIGGIALSAWSILAFVREDVRPPLPAQGPPLGSRAPPSYFG